MLLTLRRRLKRASFAGQTVVITGGSRGLGLALAERLVRDRVNLVAIARDESELASAKSILLNQGQW